MANGRIYRSPINPKKEMKIISRKFIWRVLQISLAVIISGGFVAAQKAKKTPSAEGFYNRGAAQMERKDFLNAIENFDRAIRLTPGEAKFFLKRGECYYEIYQFE